MKTVDDLLQELKVLRTKKRYSDGSSYVIDAIDSDNFGLVENLIREFLLDHHDSEIGEMQGKIFAYEEIIKKSNFAPFLPDYQTQPYSLDISKAETEKVRGIPTSRLGENPFAKETKETTEKETMFYSEFRETDDFGNTDYIYWFDLSGNIVFPDMVDKIFKYYSYKIGDFKIMIVFIEK